MGLISVLRVILIINVKKRTMFGLQFVYNFCEIFYEGRLVALNYFEVGCNFWLHNCGMYLYKSRSYRELMFKVYLNIYKSSEKFRDLKSHYECMKLY